MSASKSEKAYRALMLAIRDNQGVECEQYQEFYYPEDYSSANSNNWDVRFAKTICERCPVRMLCLDYALKGHEANGIWGGFTAAERAKMIGIKRF